MIDILKSKYGKLSHTRTISVFAAAMVWGIWAKTSLCNGTLQPIPESVALLLSALVTASITNTHLSETKVEKGETDASAQTTSN